MMHTPATAKPPNKDCANVIPVNARAIRMTPNINTFLIVFAYLVSVTMEFAYSSLGDSSGCVMMVLCECDMCTFLTCLIALLLVLEVLEVRVA